MFVKENMLNDKFCFFGWSLRIHYYFFMFRWNRELTDKIKIEVYDYGKTGKQ